jgi:hypothetical protein
MPVSWHYISGQFSIPAPQKPQKSAIFLPQAPPKLLNFSMAFPRTNCGFVFVPVTQDFLENRQSWLVNLTIAHKYDQKLLKCIGASFATEENG